MSEPTITCVSRESIQAHLDTLEATKEIKRILYPLLLELADIEKTPAEIIMAVIYCIRELSSKDFELQTNLKSLSLYCKAVVPDKYKDNIGSKEETLMSKLNEGLDSYFLM
jgi:hypothetical protein